MLFDKLIEYKMNKVKPAIYEFPIFAKGNYKEALWGWHKLSELAEITEYCERDLLYNFLEHQKDKWTQFFNGICYLAIITQNEHGESIGVGWYNHHELFDPVVYYRDEAGKEASCKPIDNLLRSKHLFVPAGWGLAVIDEVKKKKEKIVVCKEE